MRQDREAGYGGVTILIHKAIAYQELNWKGLINNIVMLYGIKLNNLKFSFFSLYKPAQCHIACVYIDMHVIILNSTIK